MDERLRFVARLLALESRIVQLRREHPSWGAPKFREKIKRLGLGVSLPAVSTVHAVLDRHGLVSRGRRTHRFKAEGSSLSRPDQPNDLCCADYKGEFMLAEHRYCYPLTITDFASCYLLCCEGLQSIRPGLPDAQARVRRRRHLDGRRRCLIDSRPAASATVLVLAAAAARARRIATRRPQM